MNHNENARYHDIWNCITFSIASVGLSIVIWYSIKNLPITVNTSVGDGIAAFGTGNSIKHHKDSIKQIKTYESKLH